MFDKDMKEAIVIEDLITLLTVKLSLADKPVLIMLRDLLTDWKKTNLGAAYTAEKLWFRATETLIEHHLLELEQA